MEKKVLIACPIWFKDISNDILGRWLKWVENQDYKNYKICICVNGQDYNFWAKRVTEYSPDIIVLTAEGTDNPLTYDLGRRCCIARDNIRQYALANGFDCIFWLDADTIPDQNNVIQGFIDYGKDFIIGIVLMTHNQRIAASNFDNIWYLKEDAMKLDELTEIDGSGFAFCLFQGEAMQIPILWGGYGYGDDAYHTRFTLKRNGIKKYLTNKYTATHYHK